LKVVIINTFERSGGAAVAANRLMHALNKVNIETKMLVRDKQTDDENVISINTTWIKKIISTLRFYWERFIIFLNNKFSRETLFQVSIANTGTDISRHPLIKEADILHIQWINQGFLSLKDILKLTRMGKPIVWTMHDMWPCTGICHHSYGCKNFEGSCGNCPLLQSSHSKDLSYKTLQKKLFFSLSQIYIVTVSSWLHKMAAQSSVTGKSDMQIIPNLLDLEVFEPDDKKKCRDNLGLPHDKKIIAMGAAKLNDPIKGFDYLNEAFDLLLEKDCNNNLFLILFGEIKDDEHFLNKIKIPYKYFGRLVDPIIIAQLYNAADVTVVPSLYETFGQTIIESMACGCPAISFDNSGQTDIIDHKTNGYLAKYKDINDLADGITWVLDNPEYENVKKDCIKKVQFNYSEPIVSGKYISLYKNLLS